MEKLAWKKQCPESIQSWYSEFPRCNLNDKMCVLAEEEGVTCPYYEDYLDEIREEELVLEDWEKERDLTEG